MPDDIRNVYACNNNKAASEPVIEHNGATNIESDECYLIQECNELGEPAWGRRRPSSRSA